MGKVISVVSGKGGTGKTSFCAGVAVALCALGEKVLIIDADCGLRSLDIVLGMSDSLLFSYADVIKGNASLKEASVRHSIVKNLRVLTAPASIKEGEEMTREQIKGLLDRARAHFSFVLVDCPAGFGEDLLNFATCSDRVIVVSTPDHTSLRGAHRIGASIMQRGMGEVKIAVNRVRADMINTGDAVNIDTAMDSAGLSLIGAVPEDEDVISCGNQGQILILSSQGPAVHAYNNIARRIRGERVKLLHRVKL